MLKEEKSIDKSQWGDGPWQSEPDRKEWRDEATGLTCLAVRQPSLGHWCGYVAVPPGHPAHEADYDDVEAYVHGGLTYGNKCQGLVCHVPAPGEPDDVFWLGFDCAHCGDLSPGMAARERQFGWMPSDRYRDLKYVEQQCASLAKQLSEMK